MHILDQEAPGLAERLRLLPLESRRRVLARCCRRASEAITDLELAICNILKTISGDSVLSEVQIAEARNLADAADEQCRILQQQGWAATEWLNWCAKARLRTAIACGFGGTSWSDTADAVYELSKTQDDPAEILALVDLEIEKCARE